MSPRPVTIAALIEDLQADSPVRRDAAVARLRVLGARALPRLLTFLESRPPAQARSLALSALEGSTDSRAMTAALSALEALEPEVVTSALAVLRPWVAQERGTRLLEAITAVAVDRARDARVRVAAVDALSDLPDRLVAPIRAQAPPPQQAGPPLDDPVSAAEWIDAYGDLVTLSALHDALVVFRDREQAADTVRRRTDWLNARGLVHAVLARRGSRLALYDAKESLEAASGRLPAGFLEAIRKSGDASCLDPLARAWSASRDTQWRGDLAEAGRQVMRRSRLNGRSAVIKHIRSQWQGFL